MNKYHKSLFLLTLVLSCFLFQGCFKENIFQITEEVNEIKDQEILKEAPEVKKITNKNKKTALNISEGNYAFEQLNENEKKVYNEIISTIIEHKKDINLSTIDIDIMKKAYMAVNADYGSLFWYDGYSYTQYMKEDKLVALQFIPNYTMEKEERKSIQNQIDKVVDEWLSDISLTDTDYVKVKYVFEILVQKVDYAEAVANNQNIISPFLNRQTVCQGYACATQYLLKQLGIESTIITGTANNELHAWNLVKLDGEYYYVDTTWGNSTYLDTERNEEKYVNYNYLGMTTKELLLTHVIENDIKLPECNSILNNYYIKEELYFDVWKPDEIGKLLKNAYEEGQKNISIKFSDTALYVMAMDYFVAQQKIYDYCTEINQFYYIENKPLNVLTINFY